MKFWFCIFVIFGAFVKSNSQIPTDFVVGTRQFTADVYKELSRTNSGNFVTCPLSINILLALLYGAANGTTAEAILNGLHLPQNHETLRQTFTNLTSHLKSTEAYNLSSANKIFIQDGFEINETFKNRSVNDFNAEIENINFNETVEAATAINKWVFEKTDERIMELVGPDDLLDAPTAIVVNAMHFRGKWETQFETKDTTKKLFRIDEKNGTEVDMMDMTNEFVSFESEEFDAKFLEIPYKGDDVKMVFVLPNKVDGLGVLEERIEEVLLTLNRDVMELGGVHVVIPKFKIETTIEFNPILIALGMEEPFSKSADFSGVGLNANNLHISKMIQKNFIEVEEEGTTAASSAGGFITFYSLAETPLLMEFIADHPFLYYIKFQDVILFIGRYSGQ